VKIVYVCKKYFRSVSMHMHVYSLQMLVGILCCAFESIQSAKSKHCLNADSTVAHILLAISQ